jgi:amidohydrolase
MLNDEINGIINNSVNELEDFLVGVRRHIHKNPELSRQEHKTTNYLASLLVKEGIHAERWENCTGLIAEISGNPAERSIALRCEIDAIGVEDIKKVPYASQISNVMHACGHDLHSTIALGTAIICNRMKKHLNGSVKFLFQPAEEVVPGGSLDLINNKAMESVNGIFGFHADPYLKVGKVGIKEGPLTAGADIFDITIIGKSGHTARPHHARDTILCAAKVIDSLHQLIDREVDPREPFVLSIGQVNAGLSPNVIPERAHMSGTVRMLGIKTREMMPGWIERVIRGVTESMDTSYKFTYHTGSPPVVNDPALTKLVEEVALNNYGPESTVQMEQSMGGEDFSWYLEHAPGALIRIGVTSEGNGPSLHSNIFDIDEKVIPFGVGLFTRILVSYLNSH